MPEHWIGEEGGIDIPAEISELLKDEETLKKLSEDIGATPEMEKIVANMMEQIMAKDVMYKPMSELRDRVYKFSDGPDVLAFQYPKWLQINKDKLSPEEYQRYQKHAEYINRICVVYEQEPENISKVMDLMQEVPHINNTFTLHRCKTWGNLPQRSLQTSSRVSTVAPLGFLCLQIWVWRKQKTSCHNYRIWRATKVVP